MPHAVNQHKSAASKTSVEWLNTQVVSPKTTLHSLTHDQNASNHHSGQHYKLYNWKIVQQLSFTPHGDAKFCLRPRSWQDEIHLFPFVYRAQKLTIFLILLKNMTLSTWLILAVCKNACHIWTWKWTSLTIESLWLSGRASERRLRRSGD